MVIDTLFLPSELKPRHLEDRAVVVLDVLRATTTMTAALGAGVSEVRLFDSLEGARAAAGAFGGRRVLCGEEKCLRPAGFDLGNRPGDFDPAAHKGCVAFMATTNGTRALVAARGAGVLLAGALINASAVAKVLTEEGRDVTLLCAGTAGEVAMEDLIGAGAVVDAMAAYGAVELGDDRARVAHRLFLGAVKNLRGALSRSTGGRNVIGAGMEEDIEFATRLDFSGVVGRVKEGPLRLERMQPPPRSSP